MINQYSKAELKRLLRSAWGEIAIRRNDVLTLRSVVANLRQDLAHHSNGLSRNSSSTSSGTLMTTTDKEYHTHVGNDYNISIPRVCYPQNAHEEPCFSMSTPASRTVSPTPAAGYIPSASENGLVTPTPTSMQEQQYEYQQLERQQYNQQQQYEQQPQYDQQQQQGTVPSVTTTATARMVGNLGMGDGYGIQGEDEVDPLLEALLAEQGGVKGVGGEGGLMAEFVMHWGGSEGEDGKQEGKSVGMADMSVVVKE